MKKDRLLADFIQYDSPNYLPRITSHFFSFSEYPSSAFWIWGLEELHVNVPPTILARLQAQTSEWKTFTGEEHLYQCLSSQLCNVLFTQKEGIPPISALQVIQGRASYLDLTLWAKHDDISHASRYPVLLVHPIDPSRPDIILDPARMAIGRQAIIFGKDEKVLLDLDQLGSMGKLLWNDIQQGAPLLYFEKLDKKHNNHSSIDINMDGQIQQMLWHRTQDAAKKLAVLYWQLYQDQLQQGSLSTTRTLPDIPHILHKNKDSGTFILDALPVRAALAAYSNAHSGTTAWGLPHQIPSYLYTTSSRNTAQVSLRPVSSLPEIALESLWQRLRNFSDIDGDVFLAMIAQSLATAEKTTYITSDHILAYRGIRPRQYQAQDGSIHSQTHRIEDLMEIAQGVEHVRDTHITLRQWIQEQPSGKRGRPKKRMLELESYLIQIAEYIQQRDLAPTTIKSDNDTVAIAWRYTLGPCLDVFLEGPNHHMAWLLQTSLNYDPYREMWEKRLSRYFTFQAIHIEQSVISIHKIKEILDELSLPIWSNEPDKTRKRFEKAMERLKADHQFLEWSYQEPIADLPPRKWLAVWLNYHIQVTTAPLSQKENAPHPIPSVK